MADNIDAEGSRRGACKECGPKLCPAYFASIPPDTACMACQCPHSCHLNITIGETYTSASKKKTSSGKKPAKKKKKKSACGIPDLLLDTELLCHDSVAVHKLAPAGQEGQMAREDKLVFHSDGTFHYELHKGYRAEGGGLKKFSEKVVLSLDGQFTVENETDITLYFPSPEDLPTPLQQQELQRTDELCGLLTLNGMVLQSKTSDMLFV